MVKQEYITPGNEGYARYQLNRPMEECGGRSENIGGRLKTTIGAVNNINLQTIYEIS